MLLIFFHLIEHFNNAPNEFPRCNTTELMIVSDARTQRYTQDKIITKWSVCTDRKSKLKNIITKVIVYDSNTSGSTY